MNKKNKQPETNPWKIASIILLLIIGLVIIYDLYHLSKAEKVMIKFGNVQVLEKDVQVMADIMNESETFQICELETGECVKFRKRT